MYYGDKDKLISMRVNSAKYAAVQKHLQTISKYCWPKPSVSEIFDKALDNYIKENKL